MRAGDDIKRIYDAKGIFLAILTQYFVDINQNFASFYINYTAFNQTEHFNTFLERSGWGSLQHFLKDFLIDLYSFWGMLMPSIKKVRTAEVIETENLFNQAFKTTDVKEVKKVKEKVIYLAEELFDLSKILAQEFKIPKIKKQKAPAFK